MNIVILGTKSAETYDSARVLREGRALMRSGAIRLPTFAERLLAFHDFPPRSAANSPVLTDDKAPVEGLMKQDASSTNQSPARSPGFSR